MVRVRTRARREEADLAYALDYNVFSDPDPRLVQENANASIAVFSNRPLGCRLKPRSVGCEREEHDSNLYSSR